MTPFKFDGNGLIPAIVQDAETGEVLMLAYMDETALKKTLKEKRAVFYSRSRQKYWVKGETSGHTQEVVEVLADCDKDTVVVRVKQKGGACHLGYKSCFAHQVDEKGDIVKVTQEKVFDPESVYPSK